MSFVPHAGQKSSLFLTSYTSCILPQNLAQAITRFTQGDGWLPTSPCLSLKVLFVVNYHETPPARMGCAAPLQRLQLFSPQTLHKDLQIINIKQNFLFFAVKYKLLLKNILTRKKWGWLKKSSKIMCKHLMFTLPHSLFYEFSGLFPPLPTN